MEAIVARPNITGYIAYHTFSGVHLRPYGGYDDDHFPTPDLRAYKLIGAEATKRTGYPAISIFHEFKYDPKTSITGSTTDWFYDHIGVYSWTTEFWSPQRQAGIEDFGYIEWMKEHPPEDDLKLLRWNDEQLDGKGYVDWYEFDHPQLGKVELGGWDVMYCWGNVPPQFLEAEIAPHSDWALWHLLISPRLEVKSLDVDDVGEGTYKVRLVLQNTGWLPTQVTQKAVERKAVRPLEVELTLPEGAELVVGEQKTEAGQLEGRVHKRSVLWWGGDDSTADLTKLEWVIEAPAGRRARDRGEASAGRHRARGCFARRQRLVSAEHEPDQRRHRRSLEPVQGALAAPAVDLVRRLSRGRADRRAAGCGPDLGRGDPRGAGLAHRAVLASGHAREGGRRHPRRPRGSLGERHVRGSEGAPRCRSRGRADRRDRDRRSASSCSSSRGSCSSPSGA